MADWSLLRTVTGTVPKHNQHLKLSTFDSSMSSPFMAHFLVFNTDGPLGLWHGTIYSLLIYFRDYWTRIMPNKPDISYNICQNFHFVSMMKQTSLTALKVHRF